MLTMESIANVLDGYNDRYVWYNQFVDGEDGHAGEYVDCFSELMRMSGSLSESQYERFNSYPIGRLEVEPEMRDAYADDDQDEDSILLDWNVSRNPAEFEEKEETLTLRTLFDHLEIFDGSNPAARLTVRVEKWKEKPVLLGSYDWHFVHYELEKMSFIDYPIVKLHLTDHSTEVTLNGDET